MDNMEEQENKKGINLKGLFSSLKEKADFQRNQKYLYLIGIAAALTIIFLLSSFPTIPAIFILLVFLCSRNYNSTLATIITWLAAFQIFAIIMGLFGFAVQIFLLLIQ